MKIARLMEQSMSSSVLAPSTEAPPASVVEQAPQLVARIGLGAFLSAKCPRRDSGFGIVEADSGFLSENLAL